MPQSHNLKLSPIEGLTFYPLEHRYRFQGSWISFSITQVTNTKTPAELERIFASKHIWEPRGNHVHQALENFLLHGDPGDPGDYSDWIDPLVKSPIWDHWQAVACEHRMVDSRHSIAGSADVILQNKNDGQLALADLKTLSSKRASTYDISGQLGGYLNLIDLCHPELAGKITTAFGIWARPGSTSRTDVKAEAALTEYLARRSAFLERNVTI